MLRACLLLIVLSCAGVATAQELIEGPVSGKLALEPARLYSTAIIAGSYGFLSGVPSGNTSTTIQEATAEVLTDLNSTLTTLGGSLDNAVKASVFLENMSDFSGMNSIYTTFFSSNSPARSTVQATNPAFSFIEIDLIVYLPEDDAASS